MSNYKKYKENFESGLVATVIGGKVNRMGQLYPWYKLAVIKENYYNAT